MSRNRSRLRLLKFACQGGGQRIDRIRLAGGIDALDGLGTDALRQLGFGAGDIRDLEREPSTPPPEWTDWIEQPGHSLVVLGGESYPPRLAEIADPPLALWVEGEATTLLEAPQLAIVGSRHPTRNGMHIATSLAASLSECGITITSGLALGIDAASHRGALEGVATTIAVLGSGLDRIYPNRNAPLAAEIREKGLLISEYPPTTPPRALHFPQRNRIIAGLSLGTLVIEATRRSGSLITARLAGEFGREVFATPGSIRSELSKGCHKLLREGAKLVEDRGDVLEEIAPQINAELRAESGAEPGARVDEIPAPLANCLDYAPVSLDFLVQATGLTAGELSSMLLHLEIQGKIEALPGGRYCRLSKRA